MVRILRLLVWLTIAWCVMTSTHELGHLLGGWASGGTLQTFDLAPWRVPYSIFSPDPHPLVTLWSGPLIGVMAPSAVAWTCRRNGLWFIASFCMLANGLYLATGWLSGDRYLDAPQLLDHGAHPLALLAYCTLTIVFGYARFRQACIHLWTDAANGPPQDD